MATMQSGYKVKIEVFVQCDPRKPETMTTAIDAINGMEADLRGSDQLSVLKFKSTYTERHVPPPATPEPDPPQPAPPEGQERDGYIGLDQQDPLR